MADADPDDDEDRPFDDDEVLDALDFDLDEEDLVGDDDRGLDDDDDNDDDDDLDDGPADELDDDRSGREERFGPFGPEVTLHPAVLASNWKTVLAVDALCGSAVVVLGLVLMVVWNLYVGAFLASAAIVYVLLVGRRALQWRWLRRQAGL